MTILQRKIQISWLGIVLLVLSLFPAKRDAAQEMPDAALDINNFAELKILDPLQLAEKLAAISLPILENIDPEFRGLHHERDKEVDSPKNPKIDE